MSSGPRSGPKPMRIGELAKRSGLTVETLRFYERAGVLGAVSRDASGYRVYDEQVYRTLVTVRWAQELGLRLEDIALVIGVVAAPPGERIANLQRGVDERLIAIEAEIARLKDQIQSLRALRAMPFDGECVMPAPFVDRLVDAHERALAAKGEVQDVRTPRRRRARSART